MRSSWSPAVMPRTDVRGRAMTLEEWAELDEDEEGEVVDGFLVEEEVASHVHELTVTWLVLAVGPWVRERGGFIFFGSELKLRVGERTGRKPDLRSSNAFCPTKATERDQRSPTPCKGSRRLDCTRP